MSILQKSDQRAQLLLELMEEVRLTSLNLAIASAKFKARNLTQDKIKRDLTEVVSLSLDSVQSLSKFLESIGLKEGFNNIIAGNFDHEKINEDLEKLARYLENISTNFMADRGLK